MKNTHITHFADIGTRYDLDLVRLFHTGWTYGDGSGAEGYRLESYFDAEGRYLGPDQHKIEPMFEDSALMEQGS